ncbi:MAG: NFACT RNA binding domain-containing protein [Cyclobacteriaceae bacterium]
MHNNYFFLRKLAESLENRFIGFSSEACFSQNKDELILAFVKGPAEFWIRADLKNQFSCLSFPDDFRRARKNSIDIFPEIIGKSVTGIQTYTHERAFSIILDHEINLLFKLFGNNSNALLYKDGRCVNVFKHDTTDENKIDPGTLDRTIISHEDDNSFTLDGLREMIPSFDKNILKYLETKGFTNSMNLKIKKDMVNDTLILLDDPVFYVYPVKDTVKLSLLPGDLEARHFADPVEALNYFYLEYHKLYWLNKEKGTLIRMLRKQLKKSKNYIANSKEKLENLKTGGNFKQYGDIIMANLHAIQPGKDKVELFDFYHNDNVIIKLKANISPQKNAENYYRKAKNQKIEIQTLEKNIRARINQVQQLNEFIEIIENHNDLKQLKIFALKNGLSKKENQAESQKPIFKVYEYMGFQILVGRNARNNDELTFKYGYKEDLWLHAKDVKGSHVLIKYQSGKNFPRPVIQVAAQLAAFYSSNKNTNTCPVIFTPRKFVRKSKGLPAGAVFVDKEDIIFVQPGDL